MSASSGACPDLLTAREAIAIACRTHGRKRGWHLVATLLGVPERRVESIAYGEPARVDPIAARTARNTLAKQRIAQLRAELAQLEGTAHAEGSVDLVRPRGGLSR
jgi:hypothetical protein